MEIFTQEGLQMLARWGHYLAGVTWIGLLYYFNFVQVPSFAGFEAGPRTEAIRKLVPRALWWFRWGAVLTVATGLTIIALVPNQADYFKRGGGIAISTGMLLALIMFVNVWMIIWPNQKVIIASAEGVAAGKEADPNVAAAGRKALLASRTNTFFSIPMLFFMGAASHFGDRYGIENQGLYWAIAFPIIVLLELNALGVLGGTGPSPIRKYLETHKATIIAGFVLWFVFVLLFEFVLGSA